MGFFARRIWILLAATWGLVIFDLSRAPYASASSRRFLSLALNWLSISILPHSLGLLNNLLRKSAHIMEFAVLAVLLYLSLKPTEDSYWSQKASFWALLASGCYSLADELHQVFIPGRHASLFDCLIDTTGALLGLFVLSSLIFVMRWKHADTAAFTAKHLLRWNETPR